MTYKNSIFALALKEQAHGAIAQLVEQRTENPCVPGSIPGGTTPPFIMPFTSLRSVSGFLFLRACRVLVHGRSMTVGRRRPVVFQKLVDWRPRSPLLQYQSGPFAWSKGCFRAAIAVLLQAESAAMENRWTGVAV